MLEVYHSILKSSLYVIAQMGMLSEYIKIVVIMKITMQESRIFYMIKISKNVILKCYTFMSTERLTVFLNINKLIILNSI